MFISGSGVATKTFTSSSKVLELEMRFGYQPDPSITHVSPEELARDARPKANDGTPKRRPTTKYLVTCGKESRRCT